MTVANNGNARVTNAILATKIDAMHEDVRGVCLRLDAHDARIRALEQEQRAIKERVGLFAGLQVGVSAVFASIAGFIGTQK
jgi:hypothetical protein